MGTSFIADRTLLLALEKRSIWVPCPEGQMLFRQGDAPLGLYILNRGRGSLVLKADDGGEVLHLTAGAGSILGLPEVVGKHTYSLSAMAYPGSQVGFVACKNFEELILTEPSLFPKVLELLAAEVRSARIALIEIMRTLGCRPARLSVRSTGQTHRGLNGFQLPLRRNI